MPGPPSLIAAATCTSALSRSTSDQRNAMNSPLLMPVLARIVAASVISGSRRAAFDRTVRTSSLVGAHGFDRDVRGRAASFAGFESIRPRLRARSSARVSTVAHRRTYAELFPED